MHDARDAEDKRLLEAGDHRQLLENYFYLVEEWAFLRTRDRDAADEVTQRVFLRLQEELARGKQYTVPFRVAVWQVVRWTAAGFDWRQKPDATIADGWDPPDENDPLEDWIAEHDMRTLLAELPDGQRAAAELVHLDGMSPEQAAERLGIKRNALDQRLHNAHRKLAEKLGG
jgi:RNA polymerase sigma factor (sigma-70 family)